MKKERIQPKKVTRIVCTKCSELMLKVYPWANFRIDGADSVLCGKCINKMNLKN